MPLTPAQRSAAWRARNGARTGAPGRPATQPCGTHAAYARHVRKGEPIDDACRTAEREYRRAKREAT